MEGIKKEEQIILLFLCYFYMCRKSMDTLLNYSSKEVDTFIDAILDFVNKSDNIVISSSFKLKKHMTFSKANYKEIEEIYFKHRRVIDETTKGIYNLLNNGKLLNSQKEILEKILNNYSEVVTKIDKITQHSSFEYMNYSEIRI